MTIDVTAIDDKIRDKKKKFNMILTEKQQIHQPDHQVKLINMIMKQVMKYYLLIKVDLQYSPL